jgi:dipeptidyl aminopeptidase/acylaminoacyl peptidase
VTEPWEQRFRAASLGFPRWARHAPDRMVMSSNESGAWQVYAWDRSTGLRRQVTDHPIGVMGGAPTPDGSGVVWFHDVTGDEVGHWRVAPFEEGEGGPLAPGVADAWTTGVCLGDGLVVVGTATDDGFSVFVVEGDGPARLVHHHPELVEVADLSRDSGLLAIQHAEHGDTIHLGVRVLDARTGVPAGAASDQWDGPGLGLTVAGWSPVAGDQRLAMSHEREGLQRPAVWDLTTGARRDYTVDLPGDVEVEGWWPDASALLLVHEHEGRSQLHRLSLATSGVEEIPHPPGTISGASVRPDGEVWYRLDSGAEPPTVRTVAGDEVCAPPGERAPASRPYRSWSFTNPAGQRIHGFVAAPPGPGPHPVVMLVHGGPSWAYSDTFLPDVAAYVDHGLAVAMVNYRGSTGYGSAFRDALIGNPGFPEVEDVVAGLDALVAEGLVDPARAVVAGGSWGGYVTLLALGLHPQRWAAAVAAVPVADYVSAFADEAPTLQAFDRSLFGGGPAEVGELYVERSPLTYVDRVRAPVLVIAGDNDSRCPIRQVLNFVDALRARGGDVELYTFDAGHGSMVVDERVAQMRAELHFVLRHLDGVARPAPDPG